MAKAPTTKRTFHQELVLHRWLLGFFKGRTLAALKARLGDDRHEGIDEDGQTRFFHELTRNLFEVDRVSEADLRRFDLNIVRHWQAITERRNRNGAQLEMKYFQYLSLLLTEIYLDFYFNRRQALINGLNEELKTYRAEQGAEAFRDYDADDLNKVAFWNATGSGKTLLLHVNIRQYLEYFSGGKPDVRPDKIILLTPNEGLSNQHLRELEQSGFSLRRLFDKNRAPDFPGTIEVIDVHKLGDEMGDKTVAVDAFEGNNLVLIDEGHRGAGTAAGAWLRRRERLTRGGFAFEYSATFGQAVKGGATVEKAEDDILKAKLKRDFPGLRRAALDDTQRAKLQLTNVEKKRARIIAVREVYAKSVLFDYSYKFFYDDGYGKDFLILNLPSDDDENDLAQYFTACLLAFYQQLWIWETQKARIADFGIEKPLWVFVGNTVSGEDSDIVTVVRFLARFLANEAEAKEWIKALIEDSVLLLDQKGRNIFQGRFSALMNEGADEIYAGILKRMFNADSRQSLRLVNLKGSKGELALRVGTCPYFGVISIGDDAGLFKGAEAVAQDAGFITETDEFGGTLFDALNDENSPLTLLVGSRKFTEGWSSWRVSTMGLLNMGQGEGSQIIQLFGRGVRLKGRELSLKRSLPHERPSNSHLEKLETLNIFGVRASYMAQFKAYLVDEGITPTDEVITVDFPVTPNLPAGRKLKTLKLKDGYRDNQKFGFKRRQSPWLFEVPAELVGKIKLPHAELDLYPRIEALAAKGSTDTLPPANLRNAGKIAASTMAMFDFDRIFLELQAHKQQRTWNNLRLDQNRLETFCTTQSGWYTLFIPASELQLRSFADVSTQQDILVQLLIDYMERFYKALKGAYEGQFYDVALIDESHGSMLDRYTFEIDPTDEGRAYEARLNTLKELVGSGKLVDADAWKQGPIVAICFDRHLYHPLLGFDGNRQGLPLRMRPLALGALSEIRFVRDLQKFISTPAGMKALAGRSLYLLRNADDAKRGLGFATAGNFYPDFLLWLVDHDGGQQWLGLIDPKGIRNLSLNDPKLQLFSEIKEIEKRVGDKALSLSAFIASATEMKDLINLTKVSQADLEAANIVFMDEPPGTYIPKIFERMTAP
ncbi:DEAD/DEAH box helicase family protein [Roseomonas sp. USHLN139]|uniref:DEAD/DEAH box helicase family protein n=1 Tax=Roseomonas sp. USHLN139 TaxID=3081298 RepID=UPI003B023C1E